MDNYLDDAELFLDTHLRNKDMDSFYATFFGCIEKPWLKYMGQGKEFDRAAQGRGKVTIIRVKAKPPKQVEEDQLATARNENSYKAIKSLAGGK